jgi:hypothetical protein
MLCLVQCCWLKFLGDSNPCSFLAILLLFLAQLLNTKLVSYCISKNLVKFWKFWLIVFELHTFLCAVQNLSFLNSR